VVLVSVLATALLVNPSGYEREALEVVPEAPSDLGERIYRILRDQFPAAFFGEQLAPFSVVGSLLVIGSTLLLLRRHAMWVLMVFGIGAATLLLSDEPRYYMMVLPILLLGWLRMLCALARRASGRWGEVILLTGLAIVTLNNFSVFVRLVVEQHRPDFIERYKHGDYVPVLAMCEEMRQKVKPDEKVLAPYSSIFVIMTGKRVYSQREVFPRYESIHSPQILDAQQFTYAIGPRTLYEKKEPLVAKLMARKVIILHSPVASVPDSADGMHLMHMVVRVPPTDWRRLDPDWRMPASTTTDSTGE
jgi:hypothetical protein